MYQIITAKYGDVVGERDTLETWQHQLAETARGNGWTVPELTERTDGLIYDQDGTPVFEPVNDYPELTADQLSAIAVSMNDEIREQLHAEIAPCSPGTFLTAYLERDPAFPIDQFSTGGER